MSELRFVETETSRDNLINANQATLTSRYILLQGPVGTGKTLLANSAAQHLGLRDSMLQINVDDTFDSKDLLGKFTATDVPGAFEWSPGPLTIAVQEGRLVLMEDIDLASFDVFSVLLTLLESDTLFIADKNMFIKAHPNFKIIATQQVLASADMFVARKSQSIPSLELWTTVMVKPLSALEIVAVTCALFPTVPSMFVQKIAEVVLACSWRSLSIRDILRWAKRVESVLPPGTTFIASSVREVFFREALDIFCARHPPSADKESLTSNLREVFDVSAGVCESMVRHHKPTLVSTAATVTVGRVVLPRFQNVDVQRDSRVVFSQTQHSMSLLEKLAGAVAHNEPVLLTGETGVGKTFIVQYLADQIGQELVVHNLNQQTDASDFIGGWRPQEVGTVVRPLHAEFDSLFRQTFDVEKNKTFLEAVLQAIEKRLWNVVLTQFQKGIHSATAKFVSMADAPAELHLKWQSLKQRVDDAQSILEQAKTTFMFKFEEGSLVRAWREGHWILLDEVNLASSEVLERVSSVIGDVDKLFITERGDSTAVPRHPNFRVFANMNPPTDVGKKELPPALRSKFTEFYVDEPFLKTDLCTIVHDYIGFLAADTKVDEIASFFLDCVNNARTTLCDLDGESRPPHFSLRTLTRALSYVRNATSLYGFHVALWDGLILGFATPLQRKFHAVVESLISKNVFKGHPPAAATLPQLQHDQTGYVGFHHIWLELGPQLPFEDDKFIVTASVASHLRNLAKAVFAKRPVLLEGPTSAGKSSMVQYLAQLTGHRFVRINNHESTEIQEYIGHYVSDEFGKLRFVDGILVDAVRNGHWVVLDELNLAPTEVLEALNRLLDDNCELFVADTHETVRPHPHLRIFATQNPAGAYGGRKMLSRAFRNRFLEITVDDIPIDEIKEILCRRFTLAPSFAEKMVEVMRALQLRRQSSHLFAGKHGYITPRDLFRWGERLPTTYQELAEHGFLLLAERCRKAEERQIVKDVMESVMKVEINEDAIYDPERWPWVQQYFAHVDGDSLREFKIVWTASMKRLFTIVGLCLSRKEPVLLVGETGSSKTTICQLWSKLLDLPLHILNCHQHTEASDFLGGLRPVPADHRSDALFAWSDGPLVRCMKDGAMFVLDEISLAEDSVLERLNSVLEPSRSLTLAEKSSCDSITACERFVMLATMNPGGDFGKKELSPALRNRFTEIYVRPITQREEVEQIVSQKLSPTLQNYASAMADLLCLSSKRVATTNSVQHLSIRDMVGWTSFLNAAEGKGDPDVMFLHGLDAVVLEGSCVGAGQSEVIAQALRVDCLSIAEKLINAKSNCLNEPFWEQCMAIEKPQLPENLQHTFFFDAPTTQRNLSKLLRGLIMPKAILLEGSPGVGKTSIVEALGAALGKFVVRINLSDQTDIMDLFGTYLPCGSTGEGPAFSWCDGVLLRAVKAGHWVILDELNLASQTVLEGLNALLDHRSTVYLPELCQEVSAGEGFRVFGCQNPLLEGGGRKGLPKSFLNRFTKVRIEAFTREDLIQIVQVLCPEFQPSVLLAMVDFVCAMQTETMTRRSFGIRGSPWEFNLRDVLRWAKMMRSFDCIDHPERCVKTLFLQRLRTTEDREAAAALFFKLTGLRCPPPKTVHFSARDGYLLADGVRIVSLQGNSTVETAKLLLPCQTEVICSVLMCAQNNQFCLLTGCSGAGKTSCLQAAAALAGAKLVTFSLTSSCDTVDLLGGFDQVEGCQGTFEWRDSVLVEAMLSGHWLVLDNANFCNASVLDRLNPLVEPSGYLAINEQGLVHGETRVVRPHPQFRLFATMDTKFGEISRAMRNRATEIFVDPIPVPSLEAAMIFCDHVNGRITTDNILHQMQTFHSGFISTVHKTDARVPSSSLMDAIAAGAPNTHTLVKTVQMMIQLDSLDVVEALKSCLVHRYLRNRSGSWQFYKDVLTQHVDRCCTSVAQDGNKLDKLRQASRFVVADLARSLDILKVHRSSLHLYHPLCNSVEVALSALVYFFAERGSDVEESEVVDQERVEVAREFTADVLDVVNMMKLLRTSKLSPSAVWLRVLWFVGPHASLRRRMQELPCTESATVNASASALFEVLSRSLEQTDDLSWYLKIVRYSERIVSDLTTVNAISQSTFLPFTVSLNILRNVADRSGKDDLQVACTSLIAALQRHLSLTSLEKATPKLLLSVKAPQISTAADRKMLHVATVASDAFRRRSSAEIMAPLWNWAALHHELHMITLLQSICAMDEKSSRCRGAILALSAEVSRYDAIYHKELRRVTDMKMAAWRVALQTAEKSPKDTMAVLPLIICQTLSATQDSSVLFPASWNYHAARALRSIHDSTIAEFSNTPSECQQTMKHLSSFFESFLSPRDIVNDIRTATIDEWHRVVRIVFEVDVEGQIPDIGHRRLSESECGWLTSSLKSCVPQHSRWVPLLISVADMLHDSEYVFKALLALSAVKADLLAPLSPVDPMFKWGLKLQNSVTGQSEWTRVTSEFALFDTLTFHKDSPQSECAVQFVKKCAEDVARAKLKFRERPDPTGNMFVEYAKQSQQLLHTLINTSKVASFAQLNCKRGRTEAASVDASQEINSWGGLVHQRSAEMLDQFGGYEDFVLPFVDATLLASLGASAQSTWLSLSDVERQSNFRGALFSLPDTLRLMSFPAQPQVVVPSAGFEDTNHLQQHMRFMESCLSLLNDDDVCIATSKRDVERLWSFYRQMLKSVEDLELRENASDAMKVLYKEKALIIEGDDEKRLRKLKELLPSYENEFNVDDDEDDLEASEQVPTERKARHARLVLFGRNGGVVLSLLFAHLKYYRRCVQFDALDAPLPHNPDGFLKRLDVLAKSLEHTEEIVPNINLDGEARLMGGFLARSVALKRTFDHLAPSTLEEKIARGFNAFVDADAYESVQCCKMLCVFKEKIDSLLNTYPDNPTLVKMTKIAQRILALPALQVPLMKLMTGCEVLLKQCYDWERNASTEVSIIDHIHALAALVLHWRRLELHCWKHIFYAKQQEIQAASSMLWFQLREVGEMATTQDVTAEIFAMAVEAMWSSKLGDFSTRLSIIRSYGLELVSTGEPSAKLHGNILIQCAAYFDQFSTFVKQELDNRVKPLEEDISQFCKIMRWEDSTYYVIRATAEKSHLKVARVLASVEEALCVPIRGLLEQKEQADMEHPQMGYAPVVVEAPETAKEKKRRLKKSKKGAKDAPETEEPVAPSVAWKSVVLSSSTSFFVEGAEEVVVQVGQLRTAPQNRKIRGLKMLFDTLDETGIPHTSESRVADWNVLYSASNSCGELLERYPKAPLLAETSLRYYRFARNLQRARDAERTAHADLSGAQIKRAIGTCESLFSSATRHASTVQCLLHSTELLNQLRFVVHESTTSGVAVRSEMYSAVRNASAALNFLMKQLTWFGFSPSDPTTIEVLRGINAELQQLSQSFAAPARLNVAVPRCVAARTLHLLQETASSLKAMSSGAPKHIILACLDVEVVLRQAEAKCTLEQRLQGDESTAPNAKKHRTECSWSAVITSALDAWEEIVAQNELPEAVESTEVVTESDSSPDRPSTFVSSEAFLDTLVSRVESSLSQTTETMRWSGDRSALPVHTRVACLERIDSILERLRCMLEAVTEHIGAVSKMGLVLARLFTILFQNGFCKPEDEEEDEGEGEGEGTQDGTGMDDGSGEKDVTNEIENEDQLMNMKDKEMQEEDQKNDNDEDTAADVETDFQASKEQREEKSDQEDEEDDESDKEMGSVDEQMADERKQTKKQKNEETLEEDAGDKAEDVPEDELEGQNEEKNGDEETGGFENKEEQIREANEDEEDDKGKEHDMVAAGDDAFSESGDSRSDGDDQDGSDKSTSVSGSDDDEEGDEKSSEEKDAEDETQPNDDDKAGDNEEAAQSGDDEGDDVDDKSDADDADMIDQNNFEGGEQDKHEGNEDTKNDQRKEERKDNKMRAPEDAVGAEEEDQANEQEQDDAGRSWKRQENNDSKRKDNSNQTRSQSNPYAAIREALRRHQRQMQQLDLDKSVKLKNDPHADEDQCEEKPSGTNEDVDEYEFDEGGANMGLAPVEESTNELNEKPEDPADDDDENQVEEEEENPTDDPSQKRRKKPSKIEEESGSEDSDNEDKPDSSKRKKKKALQAKESKHGDSSDEDDEEQSQTVPQEEVDEKLARGRQQWLECEAHVQAMAQQLCEQLRLILAPTVADKLQGDYKTGKRINIKKIIPYIASQYKKDRIWLRRTKPNKRSYQVVVALDDSLSMQVNSAGLVSLQSVALISKAMQQLDIGEFGLLSFGKEPKLIHPLAESFGVESGPRAFSEVSFTQSCTNMKLFLEYSLSYLEAERTRLGGSIRSTTQQLQQLLFIISDGQITEDRKELRKLLAKAEEQKQFVVLIILDIKGTQSTSEQPPLDAAQSSSNAKPLKQMSTAERMRALKAERENRLKKVSTSSITDMQVVEFVGGKVVKKPYLEDFPFPFYLVIKDIPRLPEILADAMRQWFEMLNGQ